MKAPGLFIVMCVSAVTAATAQPNDPRLSSKAAAQYDAACIDGNIADSRDIMYLSRMAMDRSTNAQTIELATDLLADFTGILYSMEQLASAGSGSSGSKSEPIDGTLNEIKALNDQLSSARGFSFDTSWLGGLLRIQQVKMDGLTKQKEKATNPRLVSALSEAIPIVRRYISKLNTLQKQLIKKDLQEKREAARKLKQ